MTTEISQEKLDAILERFQARELAPACAEIRQELRRAPEDARGWGLLALLLIARVGNAQTKAQSALLHAAVAAGQSAARFAPGDAAMQWVLARALLERAQRRSNRDEQKRAELESAIHHFSSAFAAKPERAKRWRALHYWGVALIELARVSLPAHRQTLLCRAVTHLKQATTYDSKRDETYFYLGNALNDLVGLSEGAAKRQTRLLYEALANYSAAIVINPENFEYHCNAGLTRARMADRESLPKQKIRFLESAVDNIRTALLIEPRDERSVRNAIQCLDDLSDLQSADIAKETLGEARRWVRRAQRLFGLAPDIETTSYQSIAVARAAISKRRYRDAVRSLQTFLGRKPKHAEGFYLYGFALSNIADAAPVDLRKAIRQQAIKQYKRAATLNPRDADAFVNWGTELDRLACETRSDANARKRLYGHAITQTRKALKLAPNDAVAHFNLANSLFKLATDLPENEMREALGESNRRFRRAHQLDPYDAETLWKWGWMMESLASISGTRAAKIRILRHGLTKISAGLNIERNQTQARRVRDSMLRTLRDLGVSRQKVTNSEF